MKINFIYLSWRKGIGSRRKIVGILKRNASVGITFRYVKEGVITASKEGFIEYPGFPVDYNKEYSEKNLDIFSLRLIPIERTDINKHLNFWEAEKYKSDKFSLLAMTQGLLPTDNFEFLGLYHPEKNFKFITDIAGLSYLKLEKGRVEIGDLLSYETEKNKDAFKETGVKLFKNDLHIGYVKNVHNNIFIESKHKLRLMVKAIDQNDYIKQIFVKVEC